MVRANGESARAERAIAAPDFPERSGEQVLLQGKGRVRIGGPAFTAAVEDVAGRLARVPHVEDVESPLELRHEAEPARA